MNVIREAVEAFLYREARYLDDKEWDNWLLLYAPDAIFWMPSWDDDALVENPQKDISLIYYGQRQGLEDRVFRPGQYANLLVPGTGEVRAYSFSALPREGHVEFLVRNIPGARMSTWLSERARVGDALTFTAPMGSFYLRPVTRRLLFLAGGTGLAPVLAMLDLLARDGLPVPAHLIYGVTADADLVLLERLEQVAARLPRFTFATCVADPASAHPRKGYVTHHLAPEHLAGGAVDAYLCGPPAMVDAVRAHVQALGITPAAFHYERFSPALEAKAA